MKEKKNFSPDNFGAKKISLPENATHRKKSAFSICF